KAAYRPDLAARLLIVTGTAIRCVFAVVIPFLYFPDFVDPLPTTVTEAWPGGSCQAVVNRFTVQQISGARYLQIVNFANVFRDNAHATSQMRLSRQCTVQAKTAVDRHGHKHHDDGKR